MPSLTHIVRRRVNEIKDRIVTDRIDIRDWECRKARHLGPEEYEYLSDWGPLNVGEVWGVPGVTVFFRRSFTVPAEWAGRRIGLRLETGGEGLLCVNGAPFHGVDDNRTYILLTPCAAGGETFDLTAEIKSGGYWDWAAEDREPGDRPYLFGAASILALDSAVEEAWMDFHVATEGGGALADATLQEAVLIAIKDALHTVDFRDTSKPEWVEQLTAARKALRANLDGIEFGGSPATVLFNGHSHIDVAWLWPYRETMRKCGRTFSTVTALMDEFPDYHFNCSQVPLFIYTRKYFPPVWEKMKARIEEGRFEPIGGTWVEHDTNLVSGESLVRQCLYGQRFFRKELGAEVRVGWLPDVFGYSWMMPQVYKQAGLKYFMTSKMSWNDTNKIPYGTFWWEGIDGSRLFTHLICGTYNAFVTPEETLRLWEERPDKVKCPDFLATYGWGDGGGGPTREMVQSVSRFANLPGFPQARTGRVDAFFDQLAASSSDLPVWNGEFYFECHRGTLTTQARNKRWNRKSELAYRDAEMLSALAMPGRTYPQETLSDGWETILLNQFHDVIPGSSVNAVYRDSDAMYAEVLATGETEKTAALGAIAGRMDTSGEGQAVVVFNTLSWGRSGLVKVKAPVGPASVRDSEGNEVPCQVKENKLTFLAKDVPSIGAKVYHLLPGGTAQPSPFAVDGMKVSTPFLDLEFDYDGALTRAYDKSARRDTLAAGARANVFQFFEDKPVSSDAWDIDIEYQEKVWEAQMVEPLRVLEDGPTRLVLGFTLRYGGSTIEQKVVCYAHTRRVDFETRVDWRERHTLMKVAFPVLVRSSRATFDIGYGAIERATHWNTSWDWARFEVCGHKWADLSEADYGVSILNDCKYGWDVKDNTIRLSLLRSPTSPDTEADQGAQEFTYSFFPHEGDWKCGTNREGFELNVSLLAAPEPAHVGSYGAVHSFMSVDRSNIVIDCIKKAEDGDDLIVRCYEAYGGRGPASIQFDRPVASASETNVLEESDVPAGVSGAEIRFDVAPFELKTFKVRFGPV